MKITDVRRMIHTQGQDDGDYQIYKREEPETGASYYGMQNLDGGFIIVREVFEETNPDETVTTFYYGKGGTTSFNTAWGNKGSLIYVPIYDLITP